MEEKECLKNLQDTLLDMLKQFKEYTQEQGLEFFLVGGTALGAWRHKGFIPWDDDVDIAMTRDDFEKLQICMKNNDNKIGDVVFAPVEEHIIPDAPISYLYDLKHTQNGYENTAKIDIHPIDGVPENGFMRKIQKIASLIYYLSEYRMPVKNKGKMIRFLSKIILAITPRCMFLWYMRVTKPIFTHWQLENSAKICSLFGVAGYDKEIMPREYVFPLKHAKFCDVDFLVPNQMEIYLEHLYGDFRVMPDEEQRHPVHTRHMSY